jgi:hypothetical protein
MDSREDAALNSPSVEATDTQVDHLRENRIIIYIQIHWPHQVRDVDLHSQDRPLSWTIRGPASYRARGSE